MMNDLQTNDAFRTILLVGGTGFLGTNLAAWLKAQGHRILITGRRNQTLDGEPAISIPLRDVETLCEIVRAEKVDTVVQMACQLLPGSVHSEYDKEIRDIHLPMFRLARELAAQGVALTFVSSGGTVYGLGSGARFSESDSCRPISLYGQAKLEAELHLRFLARTCGLRLLIVRPSNPYGLHQSLFGKQGVVSVILGRIANDRPLDIWGNGSTVRDYIFVEDAVEIIGKLILRNSEGTYNVGSGVGSSLLDVVRSAEKIAGKSLALNFHPPRAGDIPHVVLDVSRLTSIGLHYARPLGAGLRRYMDQIGMGHAD